MTAPRSSCLYRVGLMYRVSCWEPRKAHWQAAISRVDLASGLAIVSAQVIFSPNGLDPPGFQLPALCSTSLARLSSSSLTSSHYFHVLASRVQPASKQIVFRDISSPCPIHPVSFLLLARVYYRYCIFYAMLYKLYI